MRLRCFSAPTMAEIMAKVRAEMGEDAIIISTQHEDGVVRVTAAVEPPPVPDAESSAASEAFDGPLSLIRRALEFHNVPRSLELRLMDAIRTLDIGQPDMALAAAIDEVFLFAPLPERRNARPIMLVGPAGAGKTVSAAKLAARCVLSGSNARLISTDLVRAGGVAQLTAFCDILGLSVDTAATPDRLADMLRHEQSDLTIVDTAGVNPFSQDEMDRLEDLIGASGADSALVLPVGLDSREAAEIAAAFARIGATRLLITRLDAARRIGDALSAADGGQLKLCDAGVAARIPDGLRPINPVALSRLILSDPRAAGWAIADKEYAA